MWRTNADVHPAHERPQHQADRRRIHEIEGAAGEQTLSVWAREVLLRAARRQTGESVVVAEVLALRTIFLNLQYA